MSLRPYQDQGVTFLEGEPKAILADEPGLGKSAQAIVAAEKRGFRNLLIVCPAIGRVSWPIELGKWDMAQRRVVHVGKDPLPVGGMATGCVFIVSYDLLSRGGPVADNLLKIAQSGFFELMVLDEGQYCKDSASKRTRFVYTSLAKVIPNIWVLSGTITPNHNGELYPHVRGLLPAVAKTIVPGLGRVPSRTEFEDHFCHVEVTAFGRTIRGNRNTHTLRAALAPYLLRRRAADVRADLPDLTVEDLEFDEDAIGQMLAPSQIKALADAGAAFDAAFRDQFPADELVTGNSLHIATERRALGLAKVPLASAWAEDLLLSGQDKIILFAHHRDVCAALTAALLDYNPVTITGDTPIKDRNHRVTQFQSFPEVRVLIGNLQAAGTSITLTAANRVGIVEPSWVPGENAQAIRRSYRIGQTRPVIATYLSVASSIDARITDTLIRKADDIAELLDHEEENA